MALDGLNALWGGMNAVTPLLPVLIALLGQGLLSAVGYLNPNLYKKVAISPGTFHDVTKGNNGAYPAGPGWEACAGWGSLVPKASYDTPDKPPRRLQSLRREVKNYPNDANKLFSAS